MLTLDCEIVILEGNHIWQKKWWWRKRKPTWQEQSLSTTLCIQRLQHPLQVKRHSFSIGRCPFCDQFLSVIAAHLKEVAFVEPWRKQCVAFFKKKVRTIFQTGAILLRMKSPGRLHYFDVIYLTRDIYFNTYVYSKVAGIPLEYQCLLFQ